MKKRVLLRLISPGQHFIETGTYKGETALAVHAAGHPVTTIEVHKPLFDSFSPSLQKAGIECILGDSGQVFRDLLPKFKQQDIFFWLDGHYSGGVTGKGTDDTPILKELDHIREILIPSERKITIAIDDFRCFPHDGQATEYPPRNQLVDWSRKYGFVWDIEHDIFVMGNGTQI